MISSLKSAGQPRQSNIELLRIIGMFGILLSHFAYHGTYSLDQLTPTKTLLDLFQIGARLGVMTFVFIGAYFLVDRPFKLSRPVRLFIETVAYSYLIGLGLTHLRPEYVTAKRLPYLLFPIPGAYWFVDYYLLLLLLAPWLDRFLSGVSLDRLRVGLWIWFLLGFVAPLMELYDLGDYRNLSFFLFAYILMYYLRQADPAWARDRSWIRRLLRGSGVALVGQIILANLLAHHFDGFNHLPFQLMRIDSAWMLAFSFCLFLYLRQVDLGSRPWINQWASAMFGVYLIHEQPAIRDLLWRKVDNAQVTGGVVDMLVYGLTVVVGLFLVFSLLAWLVNWGLNLVLRPMMRRLDAWFSQKV